MATRKIKAVETNPFVQDAKKIIETPMQTEVGKSFMEYSLAVVFSRALPSAIDGLKPVQRRIIYSMNESGYTHVKGYVKAARPVSNTMGIYHPHGDSSIYEAMAKMAQPFYLNVPYIDGYGNWGDAGGSGPAASRYTECRLFPVAQLVLGEVNEGTVDFRPNYDGETEEPVVLPVQFPTLLINGVTGIAVGFATNMAPHNPSEVMDATRWLLTHPDATLEKLMEFIPGPDFPTGGTLVGLDAIKKSYETGKGIFHIRSKGHVEALGRGKHDIVFTEVPYATKMDAIIESIKNAIESKKLVGIVDIKDLTDRKNGTRLVIETKAGINPDFLMGELFKHTMLKVSFGVNNTVLVDTDYNGVSYQVPKIVGLKELLEIFIAHRISVVTRRTQNRLNKKNDRLHIVEGMIKALDSIDEVIKIIRGSADTTTARLSLIKRFKLSEIQADYVLGLELRRLTKFDKLELEQEKNEILKAIAILEEILANDTVLRKLIADELTAVKKKIDQPRRSEILGGSLAEHLAESKKIASSSSVEVADDPCFISLNKRGQIVRNAKPARNSIVAPTTTRGKFMMVTNKGRAFRIESIHVGEKAASVASVLPTSLDKGERILTVFPVDLSEGKVGGLAMGTRKGIVKVQAPNWPKNSDEFSVIALDKDDEILNARWIDDNTSYDFVFITSDSSLLTFGAEKVRPQSSGSGSGVAGLKYNPDEVEIIDFSIVSHEERKNALVVSVSDAGNAKFTPYALYPQKGRATGGVRSLKMNRGETKVVYSTVAVNPELIDSDGNKLEILAIDPRRDGTGKPLGGIPVK